MKFSLVLISLQTPKAQSQQEDPSQLLAAAQSKINASDYAGADRILRDLLSRAPALPAGHFLLGFTLLHEQKPAESLQEYTTGAKFKTPGPDDLVSVASDYVLLKDYTDAEHWFRFAASLAPERAATWFLLGRTQYNENHWADAEASFLRCLQLDSRNVRAEYNLGLTYEMLQRPDNALTAYREAITWQDTSPIKDPQPYLDLGMLLRRQGNAQDALPPLRTAAELGPRNPLIHEELGLTYEQLGQNPQAIAELKQAVLLVPKVEALHFFLGRLYRVSGDKVEATREFTEAARLASTHSDEPVPNLNVSP